MTKNKTEIDDFIDKQEKKLAHAKSILESDSWRAVEGSAEEDDEEQEVFDGRKKPPLIKPKVRIESVSVNVKFAPKFQPLFKPWRYKVFYGGRGSAKSWSIARALVIMAHGTKIRVACLRELQTSIADSVHKLLEDQIISMGLAPFFHITQNTITNRVTGSYFLFKGLRHNATEIKSLEGIDIAWVEEAERVSKDSWDLLIPTIRKEGSEIWVSFNPNEDDDDTFRRFVKNKPDNACVVKVSWRDNPWFPSTLDAERRYCLRVDPEAYQHIWEGECKKVSDALIFKKRYTVEPFVTPQHVDFMQGVDWGFSVDPTVAVRLFITDEPDGKHLWIDQEAYGHEVELDEIPQLFDSIPTMRVWPIKADCARPETISHIRGKGFNIEGAKKWTGSVEDGIAFIKSFVRIHIHDRCKHVAEEFSLYSYKTDRITNEVLPVIIDRHNHCIDAIRYALDKHIKASGTMGVWERLS